MLSMVHLHPNVARKYDMLQWIPEAENGFTNPAYNLSYPELFPD